MSKRQMEEDTGEGPSGSTAKRSRVDISDLLGNGVEAGPSENPSKASRANVQNSSGRLPAADNHTTKDRGEAVKGSNSDLIFTVSLPPATGQAVTQSANPNATLQSYPRAVYVAQYRNVGEYDTDQHVIGVFIDVQRANEVVIHEFLNYHQPDESDDHRKRSYGPDGELSCSFLPNELGEGGMEFWVERHVLNEMPRNFYRVPDFAVRFDSAFEGYDDSEEEDDGLEE